MQVLNRGPSENLKKAKKIILSGVPYLKKKKILICDARSRVVTTLIQGPLSAVIALDYVNPRGYYLRNLKLETVAHSVG